MRGISGLFLVASIAACAEPACPVVAFEDPQKPNLLVVIIDDAGVDQYAPWGAAEEPVLAPTMDCLCDAGLRFETVWASPFCSPARAALLTGLHPRRDGIGRFINQDTSTWELPLTRRTMAEALAEEGYATAFYGKWHLAAKQSPAGPRHPNIQGFERFA
ncbi:MAG: sulfatase-like hydrolase/transferase, partial [Myxococcota bacterium]